MLEELAAAARGRSSRQELAAGGPTRGPVFDGLRIGPSLAGAGRGLFATRTFAAGAVLITEVPLRAPSEAALAERLAEGADGLLEAYLHLAPWESCEVPEAGSVRAVVEGIMQCNAFVAAPGAGGRVAHLMREVSLVNHSCCPNASVVVVGGASGDGTDGEAARLVAAGDITAGEAAPYLTLRPHSTPREHAHEQLMLSPLCPASPQARRSPSAMARTCSLHGATGGRPSCRSASASAAAAPAAKESWARPTSGVGASSRRRPPPRRRGSRRRRAPGGCGLATFLREDLTFLTVPFRMAGALRARGGGAAARRARRAGPRRAAGEATLRVRQAVL